MQHSSQLLHSSMHVARHLMALVAIECCYCQPRCTVLACRPGILLACIRSMASRKRTVRLAGGYMRASARAITSIESTHCCAGPLLQTMQAQSSSNLALRPPQVVHLHIDTALYAATFCHQKVTACRPCTTAIWIVQEKDRLMHVCYADAVIARLLSHVCTIIMLDRDVIPASLNHGTLIMQKRCGRTVQRR